MEFLDLRNAVVPLTTLLALCDTNTGANGLSGQNVILHLISVI